MIPDDIDKILSDAILEEEKLDHEEWWCLECEHGPMNEKETKCSRCGAKNGKFYNDEELTGWEDEDIESEVEEIY